MTSEQVPAPARVIAGAMRRLELPTVKDTTALGAALGRLVRAGDLVILTGALGAGKTALAKGIGVGMKVIGTVMSPTFVIARWHRAVEAGGVGLVHVDAYRLADAVELDDLDLDTDLTAAVVVVEWGGGMAERLAEAHLTIDLQRRADDSRLAVLIPVGGDWAARVAGLPG